jgi:putative nucleotidyltransferase with HDIG domain
MSVSVLLRRPITFIAAPAANPRQTILKDLERVESYPVLSETTIRAMAMVNNPNTSLAEVATIIRRDPVMTAAVLRRANNWTYGGRSIANIQQAVNRVGLQECSKLLCMMGTRAMYEKHSPAVRERCDAVHRHSLFVAQLASELNRTAGFGFSGAEFTAGLLHDIGRVIMFVKCPQETTNTAPTSAAGEDVLSLERSRYGIDHCSVGHQFAQKNNLPDPLQRAILNHHRPQEDAAQPELVGLVGFANRLANYAQCEHNVTKYDLSRCPVFPMLERRFSGSREVFVQSLPGVVVRALKNTRVMLKSCA